VTRQPQHAEPEPVGDPLARALERMRRTFITVPDGTLGTEQGRAAVKQARWERLCPQRWRAATFDTLDPAVRRGASAWLGRLTRDPANAGNLILLGKVGTGKTWAALALARVALERMAVRFAPVPALLDSLRPDGDGFLSWYTRAGLLVLDDLGAERLTDWGAEQLYLVVNDRWMHQRPIVATSNLDPDQIAERVGARTWDRLRDGATAVAIAGTSRRRPRSHEGA
jgi:DNA replication protein DnaC